MEGENGLYGRLDQAAYTRFLQRSGRRGRVVTNRNHIVARSQREHSVGDTGQQTDHAMRVVGHRDFASTFIRQDAACLARKSPAGPGGHYREDNQSTPHAVAASVELSSSWPLSTNGRPATSRSTLDATRATLWFISPSRSRKRRPDG